MASNFFCRAIVVTGILSMIFGFVLVGYSAFSYSISSMVMNSADENMAATVGQSFDTMFYDKNGLGYEYLLPKIDETQNNRIELPVGVTQEFISRLILTQAAVQESFSSLRLASGQMSVVYMVLGSIGMLLILFGFALIILQLQLNKYFQDKQ